MTYTCAVCGEKFDRGYTIAVLISSCGRVQRLQKYQQVAQVCEKCGNAPGGRRARPVIWMGLRDAARQAIAHIATVRDVLTRGKV